MLYGHCVTPSGFHHSEAEWHNCLFSFLLTRSTEPSPWYHSLKLTMATLKPSMPLARLSWEPRSVCAITASNIGRIVQKLSQTDTSPRKYLGSAGISKETTAKAASTVVSRFLLFLLSTYRTATAEFLQSGHETHLDIALSTPREKKKRKEARYRISWINEQHTIIDLFSTWSDRIQLRPQYGVNLHCIIIGHSTDQQDHFPDLGNNPSL